MTNKPLKPIACTARSLLAAALDFKASELQTRSPMSKQYKIGFNAPPGYDPGEMFKKLPSPIHRHTMTEIYNYRIGSDGFYFVDQLVDGNVASQAFRVFVDEALKHSASVEITQK